MFWRSTEETELAQDKPSAAGHQKRPWNYSAHAERPEILACVCVGGGEVRASVPEAGGPGVLCCLGKEDRCPSSEHRRGSCPFCHRVLWRPMQN